MEVALIKMAAVREVAPGATNIITINNSSN